MTPTPDFSPEASDEEGSESVPRSRVVNVPVLKIPSYRWEREDVEIHMTDEEYEGGDAGCDLCGYDPCRCCDV